MKITMHSISLLLFSVLQATWMNSAAVFGVKPNLFLVYIVIISFFCYKTEGAVLGGFCGLFLDIIIGRFLGLNIILGMLTGFFVAYLCEKIIRTHNIFVVMLVVMIMTMLYESIYYTAAFSVIIKDSHFLYSLTNIVLPETIYNGVIALAMYLLLKRATKYLYADKGEDVG